VTVEIGLGHHVLLKNTSILITMFTHGSLTGCWTTAQPFKKTLFCNLILKCIFFVLECLNIHEWQFHNACIERSIILLGCDICVDNFWVERKTAFIIKPPHSMPPTPQKPSYHYQNPQKIFDNNIIVKTLSFETCFCCAEHYLSSYNKS
jgi:hypothetical protein